MTNWIDLFSPADIRVNSTGIALTSKLLGIILQQAKRYKGFSEPTEWWENLLNDRIQSYVSVALDSKRVITKDKFKIVFPDQSPYIMSTHCDFVGNLRSKAEKDGIPLVNISLDDISAEQQQQTLKQTLESYENLAKNLIENLHKINRYH